MVDQFPPSGVLHWSLDLLSPFLPNPGILNQLFWLSALGITQSRELLFAVSRLFTRLTELYSQNTDVESGSIQKSSHILVSLYFKECKRETECYSVQTSSHSKGSRADYQSRRLLNVLRRETLYRNQQIEQIRENESDRE